MANTKISQLPSWTGTAADLRWFVMNNSGETETFKFSGYTSPFKVAAGTKNSNNIYDTIVMGGSYSAIVGGDSNTSTGSYGAIIGGQSQFQSANYGIVIGGYGNNNSSYAGVVGGYANTNGGEVNIIFGNQCVTQGTTGGIIGSLQSRLNGTTVTNKQSFIGGGNTNIITTTLRATILGGQNNTITSSPDSSIIGGTGNTMSSKTNVVMIGCSGRTATTNTATFVENLVVFNYSNLDYADDTAAAAGGVVLGQVYHNNGALRIRVV
jgi:hypothetical protein